MKLEKKDQDILADVMNEEDDDEYDDGQGRRFDILDEELE